MNKPIPLSTGKLPPRRQMMVARTTLALDEVEALASDLLKRRPDQTAVRQELARLLEHLRRPDEALRHWQRLSHDNPKDFEAAYHVANAAMNDGAGADEAVELAATRENTDAFRAELRGALASNRAQPPVDTGLHHVSICGVSFSGSTLMDRILGGLPGVRSIGESHWLIKARYETRYDLIDFNEPTAHPPPQCSVCGPKCEVLTMAFRRDLAADLTDWYFRIARRLDTKILISADKNPPKLVDLDPLLRFSALVMFKSPVQAWISHREKLPAGQTDESHLKECRSYLDTWSNSYTTLLHHFAPKGGKVFLSFDRFVADPRPNLEGLCRALDLPFDPAVLVETRPGHAIGGNSRAMARIRAIDYRIEILPLPEPLLPPAELAMIEGDETVQRLHRELLAACDATIPR